MYIIRTLSAGTYVICTLSAELLMVSVDLNYLSTRHLHVIRMHTHHPHVICTSSAALLMVTVELNYLSTVTGTGY